MTPHLAFRTRRRIIDGANLAGDLAVAISAGLLVFAFGFWVVM